MTAQADVVGPAWLDDPGIRKASDIGLGAILLAVAALAIASGPGAALLHWKVTGEWAFPTVISTMLAIVSLALIARGGFSATRDPTRWRLRSLMIIAAILAAALLAARQWGHDVALRFGPAEYAALIAFVLSLGTGLACLSHVRAVGLVLLGLLLSTVGVDVSSGGERLTMGLEELADGIAFPALVLGLIVVADSALCLLSPTLLLESYARQVAGRAAPRVPAAAGIVLRAAAVLAIAAACYAVFALNASLWDVGQLMVFGAFGVACKLLGWNRLLLVLAFPLGRLLEENIARALLLSQGDPAIFARPLSATFLLLACLVLAAAAFLSVSPRGREPTP